MKYLCIIALFCLTSCQKKQSENLALQAENKILKRRILDLENSLLKKDKQVRIPNTEIKELKSRYNGQLYSIKISLPKNYHQNTQKKYPVLYVTDAETNFGGVSYIVQRLIKDQLIPEIVVVGISYNTDYKNFYRLRSRDLTPVEDPKLKMGNKAVDPTGGAPKFRSFLEFELFPFIEQSLRVKKEDRALYGHSYGGLFGSYVLLEKPSLFNRYLLLGPSLWFKDKLLIDQLTAKNLNPTKTTSLYMGSGALDLRIKDYQEEFVQLLKEKNIPFINIKSEVIPNETHRTIFGVGFTHGLRFIYNN